jgi:hypothetical protein
VRLPWRQQVGLSVLVLFCSGVLLAQPPGNALIKEGNTYRHEASKSSFKLPAGWEVVDTKSVTNQPSLAIRKPFDGIDVLITWTKLHDIKFEEAVETEVNELAKTYGKDKVAKKDPITVENKSIAVIEVGDGPDRNGKQMGMVYLFDAGPDARDRWKVKIRAVINKAVQAEGTKAVAGILQQFQW